MDPAPKTCASCGRTITWRKKWERSWDEVRYCSTTCRRHGVTDLDRELERRILALLATSGSRAVDVTEAVPAAVVAVPDRQPARGPSDLGEAARRAARRLAAAGEVVVVQGGRVVDPSTAKGPIQVRRVRRG